MQPAIHSATLLRKRFPVAGIRFEDADGLTRVHVDTPQAKATVYLQGAHLTAWQPAGFEQAIMLSHKSLFAPGKPIRGGIPIVFPWFATDSKKDRMHDASGDHPGPSHGFARIQEWDLVDVKPMLDGTRLVFTLGPTEMSRSMGYDEFSLTLEFFIGKELTLQMTVRNPGKQPMTYEQAFHTYYRVADIHEVGVSGLEPTAFIDKTDAMKLKPAEHGAIRFKQPTDRVYNDTTADCMIHDEAGGRRITVSKTGSHSTIVWNAFAELPDLGPWDWHEYVAVETGNVGADAITLAPGAQAVMKAHVTLAHTAKP